MEVRNRLTNLFGFPENIAAVVQQENGRVRDFKVSCLIFIS